MDLFVKEIRLKSSFEGCDKREYPFSLPFVQGLEPLKLKSNVTFLVGDNGTGKSTLLEAIAVNYGFNPEGGSKNFDFSTSETHSSLYEHITLSKGSQRPKDGFFLRAESFYNVASEIDQLELHTQYGGKSLHEQSHGESFLSLITNRFWGNGLYILDEPEAALSPQRQLTLLASMGQLVNKNSQFIIATHSPILMAFPHAQIFVLSDEGLALTPYKETEHYLLTKQFLENPEAILRHLID